MQGGGATIFQWDEQVPGSAWKCLVVPGSGILALGKCEVYPYPYRANNCN